jgi:hypothetical protein
MTAPPSVFPLQMPSLHFEPRYYRPHGISDWAGHVPFAYDLVAAVRPAVIVELGAHYGQSYFMFCQAVADGCLPSRTFAVDTWRGDSHVGAYGEEVFGEVSEHNQRYYERFSSLLRMSFDQALDYFADASIDILHIDGLHTYDAVRHDFETWLPKVKPGGIVLMHDIEVRHQDFGVWRLWEELSGRYEAFAFPHSCGLGVLRVPGGGSPPEGTLTDALFQCGEQAEALRRFYLICGERLEYKDRVERQRSGQWEALAQLFWRSADQDFSEKLSWHVRRTITSVPASIRLEFPPGAIEQLRVDLIGAPTVFLVHSIRLLNSQGDPVWCLPMEDGTTMVSAGVHLSCDPNSGCLLARMTSPQCTLLLPVPPAVLNELGDGGTVYLEIAGLDPS